jgi:hypothetical protein
MTSRTELTSDIGRTPGELEESAWTELTSDIGRTPEELEESARRVEASDIRSTPEASWQTPRAEPASDIGNWDGVEATARTKLTSGIGRSWWIKRTL